MYNNFQITQKGKTLSLQDTNKITINKYENKISRLLFTFDGTIEGRLYVALLNPITNKYSITPILDNKVTITTDVSVYPGRWDMILIGVQDDYEITDNNIDQSKFTYVSDTFRRVIVRDNFLDEDNIERVSNPAIDEALESLMIAQDRLEDAAIKAVESADSAKSNKEASETILSQINTINSDIASTYEDIVEKYNQIISDYDSISNKADVVADLAAQVSEYSTRIDELYENIQTIKSDILETKSDIDETKQSLMELYDKFSADSVAYILQAKRWAVGDDSISESLTDNSKYYAQQALATKEQIDSTKSFLETLESNVNSQANQVEQMQLQVSADKDAVSDMKKAIEEFPVSSVQPDWSQNDTTAADYMKNRPFYTGDIVETELFDVCALADAVGTSWIQQDEVCSVGHIVDDLNIIFIDTPIVVGNEYIIEYNSASYNFIAVDGSTIEMSDAILIGDVDVFVNGVPAVPTLVLYPHNLLDPSDTSGRYFLFAAIVPGNTVPTEFKVSGMRQEIVKIPEQYIPDKIKNAVSDVDTIKADKMDKTDPTGTGSFSLNRKADTTVGGYSHAEGYNITASGNCSHAEGSKTIASGSYSHAEGSHSSASGNSSHAEGSNTSASGNYSHAEGSNTSASGNNSHAEGSKTIASGSYSHSEGYAIAASSVYQHVQGKFNIEDTNGTYADIIGNGKNDNARSNATTVDWSGNAWYAGNVYVGSTSGTNRDEGSKKLATEEYVDSSVSGGLPLGITGATVGQTVKIKSVDEDGVPTEWEATGFDITDLVDTTPIILSPTSDEFSSGTVTSYGFSDILTALQSGKPVYISFENIGLEGRSQIISYSRNETQGGYLFTVVVKLDITELLFTRQ